MSKIILCTLLLALQFTGKSQFLNTLNKISNISNTQQVLDFAKEETVNYLKKSREEFDATDFNYAISFSDNAGLFETQEKFGRTQKGLLYALSPESMNNRSPKEQASDYNDVGEMLYASGHFQSSESAFQKALKIYDNNNMGNSASAALEYSNLGLLYHTSGRYNLSDSLTRKAMMMRQTLVNDDKGLGASMNNLGVLYKDMGKYTESEELLQKSIALIKKTEGENSVPYAISLNNQAILYQTIGKLKESEQYLKKALVIGEKELGKKSGNYIRMKINLALLYQAQNKYQESEKIYLEAIDQKKRRLGTKHPDYAVLLQGLAALYMQKGETSKVEGYLNEALAIYKEKIGVNSPAYARALYELGRYYHFTGNTGKAITTLSTSLDIQKQTLGEHHPEYVQSLEALALVYWQQKDLSNSSQTYRKVLDEYIFQINTYFPAMSEYDKSKFWENIHPRFLRFNSFVVEMKNQIPELVGDMYNYHIATKALLLNSSSKVKNLILNSSDAVIIEKYKQWIDQKQYISKLYTLSKTELASDKINLDSLENDANQREKELSSSSELFSRGFEKQNVSYKNIAAKLKPNEAAIEIIRFRKSTSIKPDTAVYYAALVLKNNGKLPEAVVYENGNELEKGFIRSYRLAMQNARDGDAYYEIFWSKIGPLTLGASDLFVSLDGIYNQINLNTLKKSDGKFLIDEKNLTYVLNTKDLLARKPLTNLIANKTALLIGNPNYAKDLNWDALKDAPLPELPGTKIEVEKIRDQLKPKGWKTTLYLQDDATESNLKANKSPGVIHIATHGFFLENTSDKNEEKVFGIEPVKAAENPLLRSGLMFTGADNTIQQLGSKENQLKDDGILNAYEAMLLNLDNTELVVLSACETGLGEVINGEGVYGLQRAFEIAGAKAIMISLWQVSDEVTQKLMSSFYKNWLISGNRQNAFNKAMIEIKSTYPQPFYWGSFVLVGK